ncbi:MAG: LOG family protein, partial [Anaerolineales bacterium]
LLDVNGYYAPLLAMLDHATAEGFIFSEHRHMLFCHTDPNTLLDQMSTHEPPHDAVRRWMRED